MFLINRVDLASLGASLTALYGLSLILLLVRRGRRGLLYRRSLLFLLFSILWQLALVYATTGSEQLAPLPLALQAAAMGIILALTASFLERPLSRWWVPAQVAVAAAGLLWPLPPVPATTGLLRVNLNLPHLFFLGLWVVAGGMATVWTIQSYRRTLSPWHANRSLFWLVSVLLVLGGELLVLFRAEVVTLIGGVMRLGGTAAILYAVVKVIRFDVRTRFRRGVALLLLLVITALPAAGLYFLFIFVADMSSVTLAALFVSSCAAIIFLGYVHLHRILERYIYHVLLGAPLVTGSVLRDYTQATASSLELDQLAGVIFEYLDELFAIRRGLLMIVSSVGEFSRVEPIAAGGDKMGGAVELLPDGPLLTTLKGARQPLLQYEIEFNPEHDALREEIAGWLTPLGMELYAPIRRNGTLEGFIALGPKQSGYTYRPNELELIQLLADQTAVALENARLYREIGTQNERVRHLNLDLRRQNERLETLDQVKSDFITIASHELRTPLTQIKGYTDILASLNDENALTREQTRQIISQIERASGTLDQLIAAMLDASKIDVDEMRLNYVETNIDTILRLAQEPLTQALRERRLTLKMLSCEGLPPLRGDFKRLVQAFTNILSNAVKFTPDFGTITVVCQLLGDFHQERAIEIGITDTGIGIDPAYHQLIFDKFFRLGDTRLHSTGATKFMGAGAGLGLTIARGVIQGHGGRIWIESEGEDREKLPGSTVLVVLPIEPPPPENGAG